MNDSIIVAGTIAVLEIGHMAFVILDAVKMRGARRVAGKVYLLVLWQFLLIGYPRQLFPYG